jgi:hypothetical protein
MSRSRTVTDTRRGQEAGGCRRIRERRQDTPETTRGTGEGRAGRWSWDWGLGERSTPTREENRPTGWAGDHRLATTLSASVLFRPVWHGSASENRSRVKHFQCLTYSGTLIFILIELKHIYLNSYV